MSVVWESEHFKLEETDTSFVIVDKTVESDVVYPVVRVTQTKPHTAGDFREYLEERAQRERWTEQELAEAMKWADALEESGPVDAGIIVEHTVVEGKLWPKRIHLSKSFWPKQKALETVMRITARREELRKLVNPELR